MFVLARRSAPQVLFIALVLSLLLPASTAHAQVPETIAYQGYLTDTGGTPLTEANATLFFRLYDAAEAGTMVWFEKQTGVVVNQGVFAVQLGSVESLSPLLLAEPLFLSIALGGEEAEELAPRVPLTAVPYSLRTARLDPAALQAGANVTIAPDADGALVIAAEGGSGGGNAWRLDGNTGTDPATDFLGTTDDVPLEVHVNGERVVRYDPTTADDGPNVVGGWSGNSVATGVVGATIAGGGNPDLPGIARPNQVTGSYGTVSGGFGNTASGFISTAMGRSTTASGGASTAMGQNTTASGDHSTAMGFNTEASGDRSTTMGIQTTASGSGSVAMGLGATASGSGSVAMGIQTTASGSRSTAMGSSTTASGGASTAMGQSTTAGGVFSFAAGRRAIVRASDGGTFAWADSEDADFTSTGSDQFLVRAAGGVGLGTNAPATQLHAATARNGSDQDPAQHVALIENTSTGSSADVLALKTGRSVLPGTNVNFVTFFDGSENVVGQIQGNGSGGVAFVSSSGDFAEYLPRLDIEESIVPGDVVGVVGGRVTKATAGAEQVMVVSNRAIVEGNLPASGETAGHELVALVGQVPVQVRGPVAPGDFIVPSGRNDGTAVAIAPDAMTLADHAQVIGRAWEAAPGPEAEAGEGVNTVTVAVGLDRVGALVEQLQHQQMQIETQQGQIEVLRRQQDEQAARFQAQIDALRARLDTSLGATE